MSAEIIICSRSRAGKILMSPTRSPKVNSVVSLGSAHSRPPKGLHIGRYTKEVLRLLFEDTHSPTDFSLSPSKSQVEEIVEFFRPRTEEGTILVHCYAGVGRSTAAAFLGLCLIRGQGGENEAVREVLNQRPQANPNPWILYWGQKILPEYNILEAMDEHFKGKYKRFSDQVDLIRAEQNPQEP